MLNPLEYRDMALDCAASFAGEGADAHAGTNPKLADPVGSSDGRAPGWNPGARWFESSPIGTPGANPGRQHQIFTTYRERSSVFPGGVRRANPVGHGLESARERHGGFRCVDARNKTGTGEGHYAMQYPAGTADSRSMNAGRPGSHGPQNSLANRQAAIASIAPCSLRARAATGDDLDGQHNSGLAIRERAT